jgi:hypothetical protein
VVVVNVPQSGRIHSQYVDKDIQSFRAVWNTKKLANPFKTRVIAEARIKTDKWDSRIYYAIYYDPT